VAGPGSGLSSGHAVIDDGASAPYGKTLALVVVQGWLADRYGLQNSFWLTVACELYVLWYALWGSKPKGAA
jgi:hypothetical protein